MGKGQLPTCPYCHSLGSVDRDQRKQHLLEAHPSELSEIAKQGHQTMSWAAGMVAAFFFAKIPK